MHQFIYLLDTNIISDLVRNPSGKITDKIQKVGEKKFAQTLSLPPNFGTVHTKNSPPG
ncbi:MAG: hypothetical protein SWH68_06605 [Thermodesulfobacteriota bacterium]|nr:hypothetical protein [Thermodesulfobacteriota bacterium]